MVKQLPNRQKPVVIHSRMEVSWTYPKGTKTKGLKRIVKKPEYDSSTSAVTVAFTDEIEICSKSDDVPSLPMRPKISSPLSNFAQINSDSRVNACGVVLNLSEAADREVTSIKTKEADTK